MSDNKKWFKVWATILNDPAHSNMSLEDVGRWTRLGAYLVSVGELGKLIVTPPAKYLLVAMDCPDIATMKVSLKRLPNVHIEEVNADNGTFIVLMRNWYKYQVDTTHTDRQKRARHKRRGEEKRSLTSTSTPSRASPLAPLAGASATRETSEELEQREANRAWQQNTNELHQGPEMATPQEISEIMDKFRKDNPRGGKR